MNKYELAVVLSAKLEDEERAAALEKVKGYITRFGGEIADIDDWGKRKLAYPIQKMDEGFFPEAMQEYCRSFYTVGSEAAMNAFFNLSKRLYELYPSNVYFLSNMATYNLVTRNDPKTALKLYNKVLKKVKNDETALRNSYVAASKLGNDKLKEKYRQQLVHYGYIKQ